MAAPPLANTFETGIADGTTITTANSDDGTPSAGDAFNTVTGAPKFSTAQTMHGSLVALCDHNAANQQSNVTWSGLGSITTSVWWRMYFYITGVTATKTWTPIIFQTAAAAISGRIEFNSTPVLRLRNSAGTTLATGTVTLPIGQWMRLEGRIISSTTVGELEMKVWFTDPQSTGTPDDALSATAAVLGANTDRADWGLTAFGSGMLFDCYLDDIALSTVTWIGPAVTSATTGLAWLKA